MLQSVVHAALKLQDVGPHVIKGADVRAHMKEEVRLAWLRLIDQEALPHVSARLRHLFRAWLPGEESSSGELPLGSVLPEGCAHLPGHFRR